MEWYGVIKKIIILDFPNQHESKSRGYSKDKFGIIDIDTTRFHNSDDPYILATQAKQVCYVKGRKKGTKWCSVLKMKPRTLFAMPKVEDRVGDTNVDSVITGVEQINVEDQQEALTNWIRPDVQGLTGDASVLQKVVPMPKPDRANISEDEDDSNDTYIGDGVVAPVNIPGEDEDIFFV
uniref:DUF4216 domain-containing protein n=1 Tax=Setaria viridis TaxID=4556 RepID=A0A4U6TLG9_SETVI|nr:hypothetical protein SEVIR_7G019500v2 [Setaria viridis]